MIGPSLRLLTRARTTLLLLVVLASAAAAVIASSPLYDPDIWWVAAAGRETLATGAAPRYNLFSYTEPSHPWIMHEWLLGPGYALGLERFGPPFFVALTLLVFTAELGLLLAAMFRREVGEAPASGDNAAHLLALVALGFFGARMLSARPSGVALLFPLALAYLAFAPKFTLKGVVGAALLGLLWSNTHGSFPLGLVILLVSALAVTADRGARLVATVGFGLVTLLNPYGVELHRLVLGYALGRDGIYRAIHHEVNEFRSLVGAWGVTVGPSDVIGLSVVGALAVVAVRRPERRVRGFFALVLLALAVAQARHVELAGLLGCIVLAPVARDLARSAAARSWLAEDGSVGAARRVALVCGAAFVVGLSVFVVRVRASSSAVAVADPTLANRSGRFVSQGPAFLHAVGAVKDGARLYVPFKEASLAIWYGFPRGIRVFYDSRNDCYSPETFRAFSELRDPQATRARVLELLTSTGTNAVLVPRTHALAKRMLAEPDWALAFERAPWQLFERRAR